MNRLSLYRNQLSSFSYTKLSIQTLYEDQIAIISLNSPKDLNALSEQMRDEICRALSECEKSLKIKVVILQSDLPKAFCAGANIKEFVDLTSELYSQNDVFEPLSTVLSTFRKPLIAAINGVAFGGGFELALSADILICSDEARFALPEIKLGLIPGIGGTQRLTKIVGKTIANRYILTGDFITSSKAKELGIVSEVYKYEELKNSALELAKKIADLSMYSLIAAKKAVSAADDMGVNAGLRYENKLFQGLLSTKGKIEGVDAFINKRKANFKNI